jgi:hypothetical protein
MSIAGNPAFRYAFGIESGLFNRAQQQNLRRKSSEKIKYDSWFGVTIGRLFVGMWEGGSRFHNRL